MPAFTAILAAAPRPAPRRVPLPRSAIADTWEGERPDSDFEVGIRTISEDEIERARAEAARRALELHPENQDGTEAEILRSAAFRDGLIRNAVARAACDPDDVTRPFHPLPDDWARCALTPPAAQRLWDELERLTIETSPVEPPATDDDCARLAALLATGEAWRGIERGEATRLRRLLRHVLASVEK